MSSERKVDWGAIIAPIFFMLDFYILFVIPYGRIRASATKGWMIGFLLLAASLARVWSDDDLFEDWGPHTNGAAWFFLIAPTVVWGVYKLVGG